MIVDDELVRIGSANFARRSMGMDTECDLAVEAAGDPRVRAGIRRIRDRLLAEHLGMAVDDGVIGARRAGSLRALIDSRQTADRTLTPIEPVTDQPAAPSETLRATLDPGEPIGFGATVEQLVPPVDATGGRSPLRLWILPAIALLARDRVVVGDQRAAGISRRPRYAGRNVEPAVGALDRHQRISDRRSAARAAGVADHCRRRGVRWRGAAGSSPRSARWRWR